MREPAATVIDPAFTSPTMTPPSSTRLASPIRCCPAIHRPPRPRRREPWPVRCAPGSMLKFPSDAHIALEGVRPCERCRPLDLASMVRLAAITIHRPPRARPGRQLHGAARPASAASLELAERSGCAGLQGRCRRQTAGGRRRHRLFRGAGAGEGFSFQSAHTGFSRV